MSVRTPWMAELTELEVWMLYDLVTARVDVLDQAELEAMSNLGGQRWRDLKAKLRRATNSHPQPEQKR